MSTSFVVTDTDAIRPSIVQGTLDPTTPAAPAANTLTVQVGSNLWTGTAFRKVIEEALGNILSVLRESRWPEGAGAVDFAYVPVVAGLNGSDKQDVVVGNGATHPVLTEDAVIVEYRWAASGASPTSGGTSNTGAGGAGSSGNRGSQLERVIQFIREQLATTAA